MLFCYKDLKFLFDFILYKLSCITRWSNFRDPSGSYNESCKQGLNLYLCWFLANEAKHQGEEIDFTKFPKISFYRAYCKVRKCDIHSSMFPKVMAYSGNSMDALDKALLDEIKSQTSENFFEFLQFDKNCIESRIFDAATKFATLIEVEESNMFFKSSIHQDIKSNILNELRNFEDIPGLCEIYKYLPVLEDMSTVRHHIRWASDMHYFKFSDLAHMYETAWFEYLLSLAENDDVELATRHFFIGAFHDVAEAYTGDFYGPFKSILPRFREGTEALEREMLETHIYKHLSSYQLESLKTIMLEDESSKDLKPLGKMADYVDAAFECVRIIRTGNKLPEFKRVFFNELKQIEQYPPEFRKLLLDWYCSISAPDYELISGFNVFEKL